MRLSQEQIERIRSTVSDMMPLNSYYQLGLFGSRLNDEARGGDVDIYLEVTGIEKQEQQRIKRRLRPRLEEMLDLPVDLVIQDSADPLTLVSKIAKEQGRRI
jgi:predicted nucleotidyltransferase